MKPRIHRFLPVALSGWMAVTVLPGSALEPGKPDPLADARTQFSQMLGGGDSDKPFETAAVRYLPGADKSVIQTPCYRLVDDKGRHIELTGVIHVGEKAYYEALDKHLGEFDAVLFELVGDADKVKALQSGPVPGAAPTEEGNLSKLYRVLAHDLLSMSMQMEVINYRRPNFVHADVSETELNAMLKAKGMTMEELVSGGQQANGAKVDIAQAAKLLPILKFLVPKDDPAALERMLAPMIAKMESGTNKSGANHEILISNRNARALEVLDRELAAGKKNLSLFYGSAHLAEFRKVLNERGWKDAGVEWRDAWVIPAKPVATTATAATPAPATPAAPAATDDAGNALLAATFRPFAASQAVRFKSQFSANADLLGQKVAEQASADVTAMKPNLLVLHLKNSKGKEGILISDGTTVTLHAKDSATYRQLPAPATFAGFAAIPGLADIGFEESNNIFPYLALDGDASLAASGFTGAKSLEPAELDGRKHEKFQLTVQGTQVVFWALKDAAFPLVKMDIDTSKLIEQQLGALGEQGAALKDLIKMDASQTFTDGAVAESFPAEIFRFTPPAGATKE